ncbi:hypothetical protein GCM10023185_36100 [Hymenobacter saemangeumensis]|uniref:Antitoxin VbhA domain-containing protein n=1 Tax=Hymenobacter saemangeumensis TaxID=1084522 RepID=A0ABP8IPZ4_9BACT
MHSIQFKPAPEGLTPAQLQAWQRRRRTAENTLEIEVLSGAVPDAQTIHLFQRYINGELTLGEAIERVRKLAPVDHQTFRLYFTRRHVA